MADPRIQQVMEAISDELTAQVKSGGTLSFMVGEPIGVIIADEQFLESPKSMYKRYAIVVYPDPSSSFNEIPRLGGVVRREFTIGLSLWRKIPRKRKWLIFSDINDSISGVGSYEFANIVMDVLRNNTLSGLIEFRGRPQFSTPELMETGDSQASHIAFNFLCETLETLGSVA